VVCPYSWLGPEGGLVCPHLTSCPDGEWQCHWCSVMCTPVACWLLHWCQITQWAQKLALNCLALSTVLVYLELHSVCSKGCQAHTVTPGPVTELQLQGV
jgi:hypothetical protein